MDIRSELECIICGSLLCDPRVLNCQHCFCLRCLFSLVGKDEADSGITVKCPYSCDPTQLEQGGIKSLKRNHRIGSMALAFRKADFTKAMAHRLDGTRSPMKRSPKKLPSVDSSNKLDQQQAEGEEGEELFCEWCTQGLPMTADLSCITCGSYLCRRCNEDSTCDHSFLCCPDGGKEPPPEGAAATAGAGEGAHASATVLPPYFGLEDAKHQVQEDLLGKRPHLAGSIIFRDDCELVYAPFYMCEAKCSGGSNGELKQTYPVHAPAEDLDLVVQSKHLTDAAHVQFPTKSDELTLLYEVQCSLTLSKETAIACTKILSSMIPAIKISVTAEEINVMDTLAKSVQMLSRVDQLCFRPMCQRLCLIASVLGYADLELLQQPILGEAYATRRQRMQRRVELLQTLSAESSTAVTKLTVVAEDASGGFQEEYKRYLQVATDRSTKGFTASPIPEGGVCGNKKQKAPAAPRQSLLSLADLSENVLEIVQRMSTGKARLTQLYSDHLSVMLRRSGVSNEEKDKFLKEEKKILATSYALESLVSLEKQIRLLWAKTKSTLSIDLEEVPVMPSAVEKAATEQQDDDSQGEAITSLVGSLMPQIQTIKDQHMELIQTNPNQIQQHQNLQGQLRSLMIQTLELFQREHNLRLREAHDQEMSHSFVYAHGFLDSLKASGALPRCLGLPPKDEPRCEIKDVDDHFHFGCNPNQSAKAGGTKSNNRKVVDAGTSTTNHDVVPSRSPEATTTFYTPNSRANLEQPQQPGEEQEPGGGSDVDEEDSHEEGDDDENDSQGTDPLRELFAPLPHSLAKDQVAFTRALARRTLLLVSKLEEADELRRAAAASTQQQQQRFTAAGARPRVSTSPVPVPFFSILESLRNFYGQTLNNTGFPGATAPLPPPRGIQRPAEGAQRTRSVGVGGDDAAGGSDADQNTIQEQEGEEEGQEGEVEKVEYRPGSFVDPQRRIRVLRCTGNGPGVKKVAASIGKKVFKLEFPKAKNVQVTVSSKVPKPLLLPVFVGSFLVVGDPIPYSFTVSAQVLGGSTFETPPLKGWRRVKATSTSLLSSPSIFIATNVSLMTTFVVAHKVVQLIAWAKSRKNA